ncbi:poly-gamma-glutamate hydrolase family protein [Streptomyces sp. NPDC000594]|uniref:poly-gamma-glutamate hydrolase family protein n=1 Tax=Streptomyces sp. NPDC000594 TaxID=3154261 RepID=UPI003330AD36
MADTYPNWAALAAAQTAGTDYRIVVVDGSTATSHLGVHAGGIEIGTSEIARAVSVQLGDPLYLMEGLKPSENRVLHITSTRFDEPQCVALQSQMRRTISYHGLSGDTPVTHLGGGDSELSAKIGKALEAAGFAVEWGTAEEVNGDHPQNIANRNRAGRGVQLEMTTALRKSFFPGDDWSRPNREDPAKRTPAFYRYRDALVSAIGSDVPLTAVKVWDGAAWATGRRRVWNGTTWAPMPTVQFFDGTTWKDKPPPATAFPRFVAASTAVQAATTHLSVPVPQGARVTDFVVSVCAVEGAVPQLLAPAGFVAHTHRLADGLSLAVAVWPYDGRPGDTVWRTEGAVTATAMSLAYRGGDISKTPIAPITEIAQHANVNRVPLTTPTEHTSLVLVVARSSNLTGYAWPDGVLDRARVLGPYGSPAISLIASDTPGTGASPGVLVLDTTVPTAACASIRIPGSSDGRPTWVLGDTSASALGTTTVLG